MLINKSFTPHHDENAKDNFIASYYSGSFYCFGVSRQLDFRGFIIQRKKADAIIQTTN